MNNKIYSESEVSKLLQRAAEIQEKETSVGYTPGVTHEELQRIAQECGISLAALDLALVQPESESKSSFLNLVETHERVFEGELDFSTLDDVVEALGDNVRIQRFQQFGRTIKAQVSSGTVFGQLELSARNGRTKLKFRQIPFIAYFAGLHAPLLLSVILGLNFLARGHIVPGLATLFGLLAFGLLLFTFLAKKGKESARVLVDRLTDRIGESISSQQDVRANLARATETTPASAPLAQDQSL